MPILSKEGKVNIPKTVICDHFKYTLMITDCLIFGILKYSSKYFQIKYQGHIHIAVTSDRTK